jgi:uncharacterized protein (PEP-CTERM system associated)
MRRRPEGGMRNCLASAVLGLIAPAVLAQEGGPRPFTVESGVGLRQVFTDNVDLNADKRSDAITEASASVRLAASRGRVRGFLDYGITGTAHARERSANEVHHFLAASATGELVSDLAFVDVRATYAPQAISAFGTQSRDRAFDNPNSTDVGTLSVSPYMRGALFGSAIGYDARASVQATRAKNTPASDVDEASVLLRVNGNAGPSGLGWYASVQHEESDFEASRRTFDTRARVGVSYLLGREVRIGAHVGRERSDISADSGESLGTWGVQGEWLPSERTNLSGSYERRFFGNSHAVRFTHRTPNTVWAASSSRDISSSTGQGIGAFGSAYDLFFRQLTSLEPDAVKRDLLVRTLLRVNGIDPNAVVIGGFLSSAATLTRAQNASVGLVGARNTVTLQLSSSRSQYASQLTTAFDDLASAGVVRQSGLTVDWAYRLSATSSLTASAAYQRSKGESTTDQRSTLKSLTALWTATLGPRTTTSVGARHARYESTTVPYDENSVFASVRLSF